MWERVGWPVFFMGAVTTLSFAVFGGCAQERLSDEALHALAGGIGPYNWCPPCINCMSTPTPRCSDDNSLCTEALVFEPCPRTPEQTVFLGPEECSTQYGNQYCVREQKHRWLKCWERSDCWCLWDSPSGYKCVPRSTVAGLRVFAMTDAFNCAAPEAPDDWPVDICD